ncbi:MAG: hypothetical protein AB7K24_32970, partial [Gemmataceae bacterium]
MAALFMLLVACAAEPNDRELILGRWCAQSIHMDGQDQTAEVVRRLRIDSIVADFSKDSLTGEVTQLGDTEKHQCFYYLVTQEE